MYTGHRYRLYDTLNWSRRHIFWPFVWATVVTCAYKLLDLRWLAIPTLPLTSIGVAVAFYLGFKNNASYDRLWEARKVWGAIVNASRSWAMGARDLISNSYGANASTEALDAARTELILRHIAWMDALRHQLRKLQPWEHQGPDADEWREKVGAAEYKEDLETTLAPNIDAAEAADVLSQINPAAHLLSHQSRRLAELREQQLLDGFAHMNLQELVRELMAQQGKAERIKNFPFPRQYATVNSFFASIFAIMVPFGMVAAFDAVNLVWLTIPFSTVVSWVFLTTDQIGDWSENPFEGLANDVPITTMVRGIERDMRQLIGQSELPPPREAKIGIQL